MKRIVDVLSEEVTAEARMGKLPGFDKYGFVIRKHEEAKQQPKAMAKAAGAGR